MRKLAWFFIIVFCIILGLAIASAANDPFKIMLSSTLNGVGGGILAGVGTLVQNLANIVSANVTYFAIYTFTVLAVGGVFWIGVKKLWAKRPVMMQKQTVATLPPAMTAPQTIIIREEATPTRTPIPEKKLVEQEVATT